MDRIDKYISIVPNHQQKIVQDMRYYAFIHYSVNAYTGKEWGDGKESPTIFNPVNLDTEQWCKAIKSSGMTGVILTCKHHDGFCLWQSKMTKHSMVSSPYKNGKGDVLAELSASCKKYSLKLGVYLSPWDRNSEYYSTDKYMDFYIGQLKELLTNYGDIFMLWLDGACGSNMDGKPAQQYDWQRIYDTAYAMQPNIAISGCAPDIRWVGNEGGKARESEWNVVPKYDYALQNFAVNCQQTDDFENFQKRCMDVMVKDMGSREFLSKHEEFMWYPSEVDVSIRKGWFYHKNEDKGVRSVDNLMKIYYGSAGGNSLLLLNIPPMPNGKIHETDVDRLKEVGEWLKKEESLKIKKYKIETDFQCKKGMTDTEFAAGGTVSPLKEELAYAINFSFDAQSIDRMHLAENTDFSQRVEEYNISTIVNSKKIILFNGTIIGFSKIAIFKPIKTDNLILTITKCRREPYLKKIDVIKLGAYRVKDSFLEKLKVLLGIYRKC